MENYQFMLRVCMIGTPIFTILAALCGFGWNYYGLKIKEVESKKMEKVIPIKDSQEVVKNVYNIGGDLVHGDKKTEIENHTIIKTIHDTVKEATKPAPNLSETILEIGNTSIGPNPYFTYSNNEMDFIVTVYAVANSVGKVKSKTLTLVRCDKNGIPIDKKSFMATDLHESDLIFKERPFKFSQKMGNLVESLFDSLFVAITIVYSNESKTFEKTLRKIYSVKFEYAKGKIPQATDDEYTIISKYLDEK